MQGERGEGEDGEPLLDLDDLRRYVSIEAVARSLAHFDEGDPRDPLVRNELSLRARLRFSSRFLRLRAVPRLEVDDRGLSSGVEPWIEDDPERPVFTFEEAYGTILLGPLELSAGKRIYSWGKADIHRPTNLLNPSDALDPPLARPIGVIAADAFVYLGSIASVETVVIPYFIPGRIPDRDSRWFPVRESFPIDLEPLLERELPERSAENVQFAGRATVTLAGVDLAASYFDGFSSQPRPSVAFRARPRALPRPVVALRYPRLRAPGLTASTTWGEYELHGEGAWYLLDPDEDDSFVTFALGTSRRIASAVFGRPLTFTLDYFDEVVTAPARRRFLRIPTGPRFLDGGLAGAALFEPRERVNLRLLGIFRFTGPEGFLQPSISYLRESIELRAGADIFFGPEDRTAGRYRDDSRGFVTLTWSY